MRVDDHIPSLAFNELAELFQVELLNRQSKPIRARLWLSRTVHEIVEKAQDVRRLIDQIEICLAIYLAKRGVGEGEHIDVANLRARGRNFAERQLNGLRRPQMSSTNGSRKDQDFCRHGGRQYPRVNGASLGNGKKAW